MDSVGFYQQTFTICDPQTQFIPIFLGGITVYVDMLEAEKILKMIILMIKVLIICFTWPAAMKRYLIGFHFVHPNVDPLLRLYVTCWCSRLVLKENVTLHFDVLSDKRGVSHRAKKIELRFGEERRTDPLSQQNVS